MKYYSEKLDKLFDDETSLVAAEKELEEKEAEKALKAKEKKSEASKIETLFAAKNAAVKEYSEELTKLRNEYNTAVREARKDFESKVAEISAKKDEAVKAYNEALDAFIKKHPEGYHMTLRDGNNVSTLYSSGKNADFFNEYKSAQKQIDDMWDGFMNILRF